MSTVVGDRVHSKNDQSSLSNPSLVISTNIHLDWVLDFDERSISGTCRHSVTVLKTGTATVDFDSSKLKITSVSINGAAATFDIAPVDVQLGSKVSVAIPKGLRVEGEKFDLLFKYSTDKDASAVKWLDPAATKGGKYPYVFTQSQAIHARSMFPCMDSPGVKTPYTAVVKAPEWCTVLMSALADDVAADGSKYKDPKGTFRWKQPVPTSAYLVALAAGQLSFRDISKRVRIWAEPDVVDAAASDFSQTEEFLQAAEALTCPYAWTRYDVLCMPPSFPYGGMENPCLTFVTPTLLTGDKSLADVIAHEIAHSWTGNLVTNSTWEHFWLNEGWTVWLERKIMAKVQGEEYLKLSSQIGWKHLKDDIALMGPDNGFTSLIWPLGREDPDDAFSSVPYEKGFSLLYYLEHLMGSGPFGYFAKAYIQRFKFKTVTTGDFKDFFVEYFTSIWDPLVQETKKSKVVISKKDSTRMRKEAVEKLKSIPWYDLFHSKGMPADPVPSFENVLATAAESLALKWISHESTIRKEGKSKKNFVYGVKDDIKNWSTQQLNIFLEYLLTHADEVKPFSESLLLELDKSYGFTKSGNAEIRFRWQSLCLQSDVSWIVPDVVAFITSQGRMKYVRPLYRSLRQSKGGKETAINTFKKNKEMYHPIARKMIEADMKKENDYDSNNEEETISSSMVEKESLYSSMTSPSSLAIGALVAATSILLFFLRNKIE